ncbi:MAG: hypothetical protein NC337_01905 [Roseburia sp.]|nr:hypothetical protein [Roseburia sp.]
MQNNRKNDVREGLSDAERSRRRSRRLEEMRRQKQRQERLRRLAIPVAAGVLVCMVLIFAGVHVLSVRARRRENPNNTYNGQTAQSQTQQESNALEPETQQQTSSAAEPETQQQTSSALEPETRESATSEREPSQSSKGNGMYAVIGMNGSQAGGLIGQAGSDDAAELWTICESGLLGLGRLTKENPPFTAITTEQTVALGDEMHSENAVFINASEGTVLAQRGAWTTIPPASMTKILTVLVAAEHVTDIEDTFTMTENAAGYSLAHDCAGVGFVRGEEVPVRDLFYGTALQSGADAAVGLAEYVAGSHEAFVELMNERLEQLGLSDTAHFTNCVGIYDVNHYCTVYDMTVIMKAAYDNPFCREVLSEHIYTTESTPQHPEGIEISNWFLRRIEDKDTHGEVLCAKTGYVDESGNCAASLQVGGDGTVYICATAHAPGNWRCIEDHVALYQRFVP